MGRRKSKNTSTKASNNSTRTSRSRRTGTVTRAASNEQPGPATRSVAGRSTRNRPDNSASNPPASKRPHLQGLNRNDISKIAKLLMDAVNDKEDTEAVETTVEDAEEEIVVQEQQSNIGMQLICDWACEDRPCGREKIADIFCLCSIITCELIVLT